MIMVIVLHVLGVGGIVHTVDATSPTYVPAWLLEFMAYCAVNCYALISGYVGVKSKFRLSGILALWMQVMFFYGISNTLDLFSTSPSILLIFIISKQSEL